MSNRKIVHVIGTGTIGEPLIGLLCDYKEQLGIDEVTFNKNSALRSDRSKVISLLRRGARLAVNENKIDVTHHDHPHRRRYSRRQKKLPAYFWESWYQRWKTQARQGREPRVLVSEVRTSPPGTRPE